MATWNSRGLRGSILEDMINRTNELYAEKGLAIIQKVPTPITPIKIIAITKNTVDKLPFLFSISFFSFQYLDFFLVCLVHNFLNFIILIV